MAKTLKLNKHTIFEFVNIYADKETVESIAKEKLNCIIDIETSGRLQNCTINKNRLIDIFKKAYTIDVNITDHHTYKVNIADKDSDTAYLYKFEYFPVDSIVYIETEDDKFECEER